MRLVLRLAWRNLAFRPGKSIASILGIAIGIATVVSVLTIDHNTLITQTAGRNPTEPESDLLIQPVRDDPDAFPEIAADLRAEPLVQGVTAFATGPFQATVPETGTRRGIELMAVEEGARSYHRAYVVAEGEDLDHGSAEREVLLSPGLAESLGVGVGAWIELREPGRNARVITRCVDGELRTVQPRGAKGVEPGEPIPFRVAGVLEATQLGYPRNRALTTIGVGRDVLGDRFGAKFWANFDRGRTDLLGIEEALRGRFVPYAPKRALAGQSPEEAAFRNGVRFCGFLSLFLGLYIIFNTMSMSLVERVQHIGLLRALGMTNRQLLSIFVVEGMLLAGLGAALSLVFAERIVATLQALRITTLGFGRPLVIHEWPWDEIALVLAAGVVFSLLGILYPFLRAARLSVIEALRRGVIELARDPFTGVRRSLLIVVLALVPVAWFVGAPSDQIMPTPLYHALLGSVGVLAGSFAVLLLAPWVLSGLAQGIARPLRGVSARLARSTLATARNRVFGTVTGLMLVFAAIFLVLSVLESLKAETRDFGERALARRVFMKVAPLDEGELDALREVPKLQSLVPLNVETHSPFLVRGVNPRVLNMGSLAGDPALRERFADTPTILLSTRCADDFGYVAGEDVVLVTASDGPVTFEVLAVTDEYGFAPDDRIFGVVSDRMMERYWCRTGDGLGNWHVAWAPGLGPDGLDELRASVAGLLGEERLLDLRTGEQIADEYLADLDRDFAIFHAILVLTVLLAAVGILNAMVIAVLERRREIGLLRSVGLTGGQVARMLLVESGVLGLLGGLLGLAIGVPLAVFTANALTSVSHLELAFSMTPRAAGAVAGGAVVVSLLAVLYPVLRANRLRLADVMRYE